MGLSWTHGTAASHRSSQVCWSLTGRRQCVLLHAGAHWCRMHSQHTHSTHSYTHNSFAGLYSWCLPMGRSIDRRAAAQRGLYDLAFGYTAESLFLTLLAGNSEGTLGTCLRSIASVTPGVACALSLIGASASRTAAKAAARQCVPLAHSRSDARFRPARKFLASVDMGYRTHPTRGVR